MAMSGSAGLSELVRPLRGRSARVYRAPGRVNLIGEHTDYNDGFVMPVAIELHTWVAAAPRADRRVTVYSQNFHESVEWGLDEPPPPRHHWSDYLVGVGFVLGEAGHRLSGADLVVRGDVPMGAGLSSSAALEVATATALVDLSNLDIEGPALACRPVPMPTSARIVVFNSRVRHHHASGEYNVRRAECREGVQRLAETIPGLQSLRDVTLQDWERGARLLPDPIVRRCRHVIRENARVSAAAAAFESGDLRSFGRLMYESHESLRDDYEVSCRELDILVDLARTVDGVYGARMTGGGFGGCTVTLVEAGRVGELEEKVVAGYRQATGVAPDVYVCAPAGGASRVD
jgi:galactokinase